MNGWHVTELVGGAGMFLLAISQLVSLRKIPLGGERRRAAMYSIGMIGMVVANLFRHAPLHPTMSVVLMAVSVVAMWIGAPRMRADRSPRANS